MSEVLENPKLKLKSIYELLCNEVPFYYVCYISKIGKKYTVEIGNNGKI